MTKMTKAQLVDENIALRHNIDLLERQLAVAKGAANIKPQPQPQPQPVDSIVVATYTKHDGSVWNKVRIGWNMYAHRPA